MHQKYFRLYLTFTYVNNYDEKNNLVTEVVRWGIENTTKESHLLVIENVMPKAFFFKMRTMLTALMSRFQLLCLV